MIKRILAGVCDPQYTAALADYVCDVAKRTGAKVTAIAVTDITRLRNVGPVPIGAGSFAKDLAAKRVQENERAVRESLDILARRLEAAEVPFQVLHEGGEPYTAMVEASRYNDLMVFGLSGLFEHGVTEETPNELIHLIEAGVRPILATGPDYREINRVLIGYSGSLESAKTIRSFAQMNLWPEAEVKVVHIGRSSDEASALLAEAREFLQDHDIEAHTELIEGKPKTELLKEAEAWDADMIVVGNSAKSLLRRQVFGETALQAIRQSKLPLFLSQ